MSTLGTTAMSGLTAGEREALRLIHQYGSLQRHSARDADIPALFASLFGQRLIVRERNGQKILLTEAGRAALAAQPEPGKRT